RTFGPARFPRARAVVSWSQSSRRLIFVQIAIEAGAFVSGLVDNLRAFRASQSAFAIGSKLKLYAITFVDFRRRVPIADVHDVEENILSRTVIGLYETKRPVREPSSNFT